MEERMYILIASLIGILMATVGCMKKPVDVSLVAAVEPPVAANIPKGFLTSTMSLQADSALQHVQTRFFASGPTEIRGILSAIDSRMTSLALMELESHRPCLDETPLLFGLTAPFDLSLDHHLSCLDEVSSTQWIGFGQKDGTWYLREGQTKGMLTIAKIDAESNVEAWIAVANRAAVTNSSQMLMHLKSTAATKTLELAVTGSNIGLGCGVQFQANETHIYMSGRFDDPSGGLGADCSVVAPSTLCADSEALGTVATSECTNSNLDQFALPAMDYSTHDYQQIYLFGDEVIEGLRAF